MACDGQRAAHSPQRIHIDSSLSMTPPIASSSAGLRRATSAGGIPMSPDTQSRPSSVPHISAIPVRRIKFSGQTSTHPVHATQIFVSNMVLTLQRKHRAACALAASAGYVSSTMMSDAARSRGDHTGSRLRTAWRRALCEAVHREFDGASAGGDESPAGRLAGLSLWRGCQLIPPAPECHS